MKRARQPSKTGRIEMGPVGTVAMVIKAFRPFSFFRSPTEFSGKQQMDIIISELGDWKLMGLSMVMGKGLRSNKVPQTAAANQSWDVMTDGSVYQDIKFLDQK